MKTAKKAAAAQHTGKVRVNLWMDGDVVDYFKRRASLPSAAPYQTQINAELRAVMDGGGTYASLLNDEKFIAAVAERVLKLKGRGRGK